MENFHGAFTIGCLTFPHFGREITFSQFSKNIPQADLGKASPNIRQSF